ncbi:hypothetical protein CcCBS67573_g00744 [Chytriomyces confervae]|uniref:Ubiquitin-like domain-containing protein n=1 Tax=Chytriomyces confervae TaxID=246404 RepID=A0A507FQW6_9FUNG|nr:hypothetical protein CcCBS67573_g00744 [Chytriomyces confervae]
MSSSQTQQVTVGTVTGKQFQVAIRPTDTVRDVKIRIEEEEAIPLEQQILMFGEKTLKDGATIRDLGIRSGSRLQLGVHMSSGPGPISRLRKPKKDDSVVVVLCKQSDGLYMLEFHVKDGESVDKSDAANQLYKLAQGLPPFLLSELIASESRMSDDDEGDTDELEDELSEADEEICEEYDTSSEYNDASQETKSSSRAESAPESECSSLSTSVFLSLLATPESGTSISNPNSRLPSSESKKKPTRVVRSFASLAEYPSAKSSKSRKDLLLASCDNVLSGFGTTSVIAKKKIRPSTAISIMRLPNGATPGITVLKSRPSTAAYISQSDVDRESRVLPQPTGIQCSDTHLSKASSMKHSSGGLKSQPASPPGKTVRFSPTSATATATAVCLPKNAAQETGNRRVLQSSQKNDRGSISSLKSPRITPPKRDSATARAKLSTAGGGKRNPQLSASKTASATNCFKCSKKLGPVAVFKCKCSHFYCSTHRYSDKHACTFNYRDTGKIALAKENPKVTGSKVSKI